MMLVQEFLAGSALVYPEKTALAAGGQKYTFAAVEAASTGLAHAMLENGVRPGDRIVIYMDNTAEAVFAIFAALKAGGVFIIVNTSTKAEKLTHILNNSRASMLVTHAIRLKGVSEALSKNTPHLQSVIVDGNIAAGAGSGKSCICMENHLAAGRPPLPKLRIDRDLASIIYTSGSTGVPKGVMLTHVNMVSAANSVIEYLKKTDRDIILNVLPLSFGYGLYQVLMGFKVGATVFLERSFMYPYVIIERIAAESVTGFPLVPTMAAAILDLDLTKFDFSALRYITNAGAAMPVEHIKKIRRLFPATEFYSMYGLTECKRVTYMPPDQIDRRLDSVGKGMPNQQHFIVDENGSRLGPGGTGELVIRGSHVMKGYWEMPEDTAKVLKYHHEVDDTVLYSGDLFRMDGEGYLYFVSRKDDIIKTRGEKVSPKEVENILYRIEEIKEAVVVGAPDAFLGEVVRAVVVPKDGMTVTEQQVKKVCAQYLEDFMVPKIVEFRAELPRTASGKIIRKGV